MKRENAFGSWWRAYRSVLIKVERTKIDLCREVVNRHFAGLVDISAPHRPEIVRRYLLGTTLREFTALSLHEIASEVGRSHSVILHGQKRIRTRFLSDAVYGPIIQACLNELEGSIYVEITTTTRKEYRYELT
jgi:hypothetical protein